VVSEVVPPTGLKDVEKVYQIEIPPHTNDVKLEIKKTKIDLPIFRRPGYSINQPRNPMTILKEVCGKAGENVIAQYHDDGPIFGAQACPFL
jgi:hypothetical protein